MEIAGSNETDKLLPVLKSNSFTTVIGNTGFDAKGDITAPGYVFYEWQNGTYDY